MTNRRQKATRFYAALLKGDIADVDSTAEKAARDVAPHRYSSDTSGELVKEYNSWIVFEITFLTLTKIELLPASWIGRQSNNEW